ncbi:S24 family peptidase [Acinetobacter radioresistens]|jgi:phage repressor protein C with HTH and peptisase S24 domain|uniref:S24 family peptidase n=1 Tax=Acinetobacter radioresistens TaxID=40216 RepID=UPI000C3326B9|nr:S24 family peptidase [Acinetobacter radioresistens]PKH30255.1 peptidase S24 [Acinetobacter radioresistens]
MDSVADRINTRMNELGLNQADLIRGTGAARATASGWCNGTNKPSAKHISALAKTLKTSPEWILTGDNPKNIKEQTFYEASEWDENTPLDDDEVEIPFFEDFSFACGAGAIGEALKTNTQKLRIAKALLRRLVIDKKDAVATLASGDSMSPAIRDGDTIHIDLGRKIIKDGKIYAICHGGLFMAKRLYNLPFGGIRVVSDNALEYPEIQLTAEDIKKQEFEIVGWVWQISSIETW